MARATKKDTATSEAIDGVLSPSQVNNLRAEGFDLSLEGFRALAPLVGTGRDLDVAAVRLAVDHDYCTARLRRVVACPTDEGSAARILEGFDQSARVAAKELARTGINRLEGAAKTPDEEAGYMAGTARLEAEDALEGDQTVAFVETRAISAQLATDLVGAPEPGWEIYGDEFAAWMHASVGRLQVADKWAAQVPAEQLVASVKFASLLCERTVRRMVRGEEDYWRFVAGMAPHVGSILELVHSLLPG